MKRYDFEMIIKKGDETIYYKKNLSQLAVNILIGIENILNMAFQHDDYDYHKILPSGIIMPLTKEETEKINKKMNLSW